MEQGRGPDFRAFVAGLAASAAAALEMTHQAPGGAKEGDATAVPEEERGKQIDQALAQARYVIDALSMLERKTEGNLTDEEARFLKAALTDLRIAFVRADDRSKRT